MNFNNDLKDAIKCNDVVRKNVLRSLITKCNLFKKKHNKLDENDTLKIVEKEYKDCLKSLDAFKKGNRQDLVTKTNQEIDVLLLYLPKKMSSSEIESAILSIVNDLEIPFNMGIICKKFKELYPNQNMKIASSIIQNILKDI